MIKVIIVQDQSILSEGLRMLLASDPEVEVVGEASDEAEALALATAPGVRVALVDADMSDARGLSVAQILGRRCPDVSVVFLSLHDDPATRARAAQAGARTFISKQRPGKMLDAIRTIGTKEVES